MAETYDKIGVNYATRRHPDPRIAAQIWAALGDAETILNVGAGTGSYEPAGRQVMALEPSGEMIAQRPDDAAPVIQGSAESLPFGDQTFDAAMAILTVHHWSDKPLGVAEMVRVSRGPVVFLTYDPTVLGFWLLDYFPEFVTLDEGQMPSMADFDNWLGGAEVQVVPIPHDCTDGFLAAFWRRPEAYLDANVRAGMSSFWKISDTTAGLKKLADDLESGAWDDRYGYLRTRESGDFGYRLVVKTS